MSENLDALTDKEKETLRLIVRGHDAKSMARTLGLSVHTINDRLRMTRRKLSVTSSREAARRLLESERGDPENLAYKVFGSAAGEQTREQSQPSTGRRGDDWKAGRKIAWSIGGLTVMSLALAFILVSSPLSLMGGAGPDDPPTASVAAQDAALETAAREWLALVDANDWRSSYESTGTAFRELNTQADWQSASQQARVPFGSVVKREAIGFENVNAPPRGYRLIRFRTDFVERKGAIETITLEYESGRLRVVGYAIA